VLTGSALACGDINSVKLWQLARAAVSPTRRLQHCIASLEHEALPDWKHPEAHHDLLERHASASRLASDDGADSTWLRLKAALDAIGNSAIVMRPGSIGSPIRTGQSRSQVSGKQFFHSGSWANWMKSSVANSRFFRTTLYATRKSPLTAEHFILHWKSVAPVPG